MSTTVTTNCRRISVKPDCPNPLFEKWLDEWRAEAADKNSDVQYCYAKALQSLRKYPIKLNSGKECLILKNFGTRLCEKLDQKLVDYKKSHPEEFNNSVSSSSKYSIASSSLKTQASCVISSASNYRRRHKRKKETPQADSGSSTQSSPSSKKKPYVPALRSGPYAILITLLNEEKHPLYRGYLLKSEILEKAQVLCDSSFTRPDPGSHYTAWSSMSSIIKKGLVSKTGSPAKFSLTSEGKELAEKLLFHFEMPEDAFPCSSSSSLAGVTSRIGSPADSISLKVSTDVQKKVSSYNIRIESPVKYDELSFSSPLKNYNRGPIHESSSSSCSTFRESCFNANNEGVSRFKTACKKFQLAESSPNEVGVGSDNEICSSNQIVDVDDFEQLIFMPGDFQVVLLVDTQETQGRTKKPMSDETIRELTNLKTNFEVRHLKVGDFAWIARNQNGKEFLLPYIVERKRMDDLGKSIKDGRFHEQKFRLRQCGLQNVVYLVEKYGNDTRLGLPVTTLHQAITNTQVVDNFFVKITNNHSQSMMYLAVFTNLLTDIFKDKTLISCARNDLPPFRIHTDLVSLQTFQEFSKFSAKNKKLKIQDIFIKHLLQLKGISVEKAVAITQKYPTPRILIAALHSCEKPEMLLSGITYGKLNRNVGPVISKSVCQLYTGLCLL